MQFSQLALDKRLLATVEHLGFNEATEIQQKAIPAAMAGKDLLASSRTGSGKTLAFLLPAMQRLIRNKPLSKRDPRVVILAPTRELAKQVYGQLRLVVANTSFKSLLILGGEDFNQQSKALARDPHFVVATPGRLADHLEHGHLYLHGLELLILDEADRMLDLGFASQLQAIHKAADHRKRQTLMFSATLDHAAVNEFGADLLNDAIRIRIDSEAEIHSDIHHRMLFSDHLDHKEAQLKALLEKQDINQLILFTATRSDTDRLANLLSEWGHTTLALSGELNQAARNQIMQDFAAGKAKVLITTDVASRGLDIPRVSHVVNFDLPKHPEEYVHRIGRTGRAGAKGDAFSLVGPKDWASFKKLEAFLNHPLAFEAIEGLEAKFKGLAEKPKRGPAQSKKPTSAKKAAAPKKRAPKKVKRPVGGLRDIGDAPMMIKKKPVEPVDDE
ncbi:DEAD/DEAH box helicase [Ferrimonas balearica]|uniref:DEAD/DEAH box helicase n=1 Tax=Ferrimonas balearica TaxID=44012 RepID=UPI001C991EF8|nr:DEAD/DEAH box helicase [Ferrimonas balearica]MBY5923129.1 DEAD/DEAH box helicase [Ferrimonas balearica]MBY5997495.1 DEAD/DEAH box helicase [Ferrimonas balearica]